MIDCDSDCALRALLSRNTITEHQFFFLKLVRYVQLGICAKKGKLVLVALNTRIATELSFQTFQR